MQPTQTGRRRFLKSGAALAGLAMAPAGAAVLVEPAMRGEAAPRAADPIEDMNGVEANLYGRRSRFVTTTRLQRTLTHADPLLRREPPPGTSSAWLAKSKSRHTSRTTSRSTGR